MSDLIASTLRGDTFVAGFGHIGMKPRSLSGACGDLVPKDDELGVNAARKVGEFVTQAGMMALIWLFLYWLYRKGIFLRV